VLLLAVDHRQVPALGPVLPAPPDGPGLCAGCRATSRTDPAALTVAVCGRDCGANVGEPADQQGQVGLGQVAATSVIARRGEPLTHVEVQLGDLGARAGQFGCDAGQLVQPVLDVDRPPTYVTLPSR